MVKAHVVLSLLLWVSAAWSDTVIGMDNTRIYGDVTYSNRTFRIKGVSEGKAGTWLVSRDKVLRVEFNTVKVNSNRPEIWPPWATDESKRKRPSDMIRLPLPNVTVPSTPRTFPRSAETSGEASEAETDVLVYRSGERLEGIIEEIDSGAIRVRGSKAIPRTKVESVLVNHDPAVATGHK